MKQNCHKLFEHVSVRLKQSSGSGGSDKNRTIASTTHLRIVDYVAMVRAVAHLRLVRHDAEFDRSKNEGLDKYNYMDQIPGKARRKKQRGGGSSKLSPKPPKPPPRPPASKKKTGKEMLRESVDKREQAMGGEGGSGGSGENYTSTSSSSSSSNSKTDNGNDDDDDDDDDDELQMYFENILARYSMDIQDKLSGMARIFPIEMKSISDKDWNALLTLSEERKHRVLDRMYERLLGAGPDCDPAILQRIKRDAQTKRYSSGRHRGCVSCKAKLKHPMGKEMYAGMSQPWHTKRKKKKEKKHVEYDHGTAPDWLSGHAGKHNFEDWTVATLLENHGSTGTTPLDTSYGKEEENGDMDWNTFDGSSSSNDGRSQTARAPSTQRRSKPSTFDQRRSRMATAPSTGSSLMRSSPNQMNGARSRSPREKRISQGFLINSPKSIDVVVPSYFKEETKKKRIIRSGLAQNSQLSLVKSVYNKIEADPHDDDYIKSLAQDRSSYDRFALPRTDLGNKLSRLRSYRNVPMRLN